MPSIRGYKKGINNQALKDFVDKYTAHIATIAKNAGIEAMKELRTSAVKRWYNSTAHNAMNGATIYEADLPKQGNRKIEITIRSYIDINKFESLKKSASDRNQFSSPYDSLKRWRYRHEIGNRGSDGKRGGSGYWTYYDRNPSDENPLRKVISMPYSIGEYLFNLPWEEGIIGLPPYERHTGTGWVNPAGNTMREISLKEYLDKDLEKKWAKTVRKKFAELNK